MAKKISVKVNDKVNNLLILEILNEFYIQPNGHKRRKILVQCDCGNIFHMPLMYLNRKGQKCEKCLYNTNCIVQIGEIYDKLTVIGFESSDGRKQAICQCSCGNIVNKRPELLKTINVTNNCGCDHRGAWKGIGLLSKTVFNRIKINARKRYLSFEISISYAWKLYEKQNRKCALSGLDIPFGKWTDDRNDASLDRINSDLGYIEGNVQWLHKDVNKMKWDLPENKFLELCEKIITHQIKN